MPRSNNSFDYAVPHGKAISSLGFPFETIASATTRNNYMSDVLRFFSKRPRIEVLTALPAERRLGVLGEPGLTYGVWAISGLTNWRLLGNLPVTNGVAEFVDGSVGEGQRI